MKEFVKIPLKRYIELENDSNQLNYLESCGVDNWDPGISISEYEEESGSSMEFKKEDVIYEIIEE